MKGTVANSTILFCRMISGDSSLNISFAAFVRNISSSYKKILIISLTHPILHSYKKLVMKQLMTMNIATYRNLTTRIDIIVTILQAIILACLK